MNGLLSSSGFANQKITFLNKETKINKDFTTTTEWIEGKSYMACVYSKTMGMDYFGTGLWKEHTLYVAMIDYTPDKLSVDSRIRFNGEDYAIDYIDDVAFQHEALFIGLRAVK